MSNTDMPKSCATCRFGSRTYMDNRKCAVSKSVYSLVLTEDEVPGDCPLKRKNEKVQP